MAMQDMRRPEPERWKNQVPPVPEADDLAMDNWMDELDMTRADIQDLWRKW